MDDELPKIKLCVFHEKGEEKFTKKKPLKLNLIQNEPQIVTRGKIVNLLEHNGSQCIKIKLNFDSPRTKEAAEQIGLCFSDCVMKPFNYFGDSSNPLTKKKYEYYMIRVRNNIQEIYTQRRENIYRNSQKTKMEIPHARHTRAKSTIPGQYTNHISSLFSNIPLEIQNENKFLLNPAEKREIQNYLQRTAKELRMIADEHRRSESLALKHSQFSDNSKCLSRLNISSQKSQQRLITLKPSTSKERPHNPAELKTQIFFTETDNSILQKQIVSRVEGRKEVLRSLMERKRLEEKRKTERDQQWEADLQRLEYFQNRFEKASSIVGLFNTKKILKAIRSSSNCNLIKERIGEQRASRTEAVINSYCAKAKKIEKSKMVRDNFITEKTEYRRQEFLLKKKKQEETAEMKKLLQEDNMENYTKKLKEREERTQFIKSQSSLARQNWRTLNKFTKDIQEENRDRLLRRAIFKRKEMWSTHRDLQQRNEKRNSEHELNQCRVRAQSISERQGKEATVLFKAIFPISMFCF